MFDDSHGGVLIKPDVGGHRLVIFPSIPYTTAALSAEAFMARQRTKLAGLGPVEGSLNQVRYCSQRFVDYC